MFCGAGQALLPALFAFDDKYLLTKCARKSILAKVYWPWKPTLILYLIGK